MSVPVCVCVSVCVCVNNGWSEGQQGRIHSGNINLRGGDRETTVEDLRGNLSFSTENYIYTKNTLEQRTLFFFFVETGP